MCRARCSTLFYSLSDNNVHLVQVTHIVRRKLNLMNEAKAAQRMYTFAQKKELYRMGGTERVAACVRERKRESE